MLDVVTGEDLWAIYQTVWGEARGENFRGKLGVAHVILNRAKHVDQWPNTEFQVVHQPWQFSAWNEGNPNKEAMEELPFDDLNKECMEATLLAVGDPSSDPTGGATHYFASYIDTPSWADNLLETARIGTHIFFR